MTGTSSPALAASRTLLKVLIVLNWLFGAGILALLVASLLFPDQFLLALKIRADNVRMIVGGRAIMVIGLASIPLAHVVLTRLLAIVETVRGGDAFVAENAARLQTCAWAVLAMELLHLLVGAIAAGVSSKAEPLDLDWSFSFTPWLAVLLLFVLARVFSEGARMREDLEGTV